MSNRVDMPKRSYMSNRSTMPNRSNIYGMYDMFDVNTSLT